MPNRYERDKLINIALDMAVVPNLKVHDIRDGVVLPDAFSIQWLQDIIDFWYHIRPFSAAIKDTPLNATASSDSINLPSDFILDVRNGYLVQTVPEDTKSVKRTFRLPLQKWLTWRSNYLGTTNAKYPVAYTVIGRKQGDTVSKMKITPTPSIATVGELWYYQLPVALDADDIPAFPNDYCIIEYLRIRALEWVGAFEPGTAHKFCNKIVAEMQAVGLMNEPEDTEIPFDMIQLRKPLGVHTYSWMGPR